MKKTIYKKIESAIKKAKIKGIVYREDYPCDFVEIKDNPFDKVDELDEDELDEAFEKFDSVTPLVKALEVITEVIKNELTTEDDLVVEFVHNPFNEDICIRIGDGR